MQLISMKLLVLMNHNDKKLFTKEENFSDHEFVKNLNEGFFKL